MEAVRPVRLLRLLRILGLALRPAAVHLVRRQLRHRPAARPPGRGGERPGAGPGRPLAFLAAGAPAAAHRGPRLQPRPPGAFKYYGFFIESFNATLGDDRPAGTPALPGDHPAGRDLLLHLPGHQLRRRRLPRAERRRRRCSTSPSTWPSSRTSSPARSSARRVPAAAAAAAAADPARRQPGGLRSSAAGSSRRWSSPATSPRPSSTRSSPRPAQHSSLEILVAIYGYAVQIYADFSGYTDIAIGVALLLGIAFPQNFDRPYRRRLPAGLLAPLAHDAVPLAARLPLHPPGRQPPRHARPPTATSSSR